MAAPAEECTVPCAIARAMATAESAWRESLRSVTVRDLVDGVAGDYGKGALSGIADWLGAKGT